MKPLGLKVYIGFTVVQRWQAVAVAVVVATTSAVAVVVSVRMTDEEVEDMIVIVMSAVINFSRHHTYGGTQLLGSQSSGRPSESALLLSLLELCSPQLCWNSMGLLVRWYKV